MFFNFIYIAVIKNTLSKATLRKEGFIQLVVQGYRLSWLWKSSQALEAAIPIHSQKQREKTTSMPTSQLAFSTGIQFRT